MAKLRGPDQGEMIDKPAGGMYNPKKMPPGMGGPASPGGAMIGGQQPGPEPGQTEVPFSPDNGQTPSQSTESPRERQPELPGALQPAVQPRGLLSPPSPESYLNTGVAGGGGAQATPPMPMQPTPQAGAIYGGANGGQGTFAAPSPVELTKPGSKLFGNAGGLMGGGLGTSGSAGSGAPPISPLLLHLLGLIQ